MSICRYIAIAICEALVVIGGAVIGLSGVPSSGHAQGSPRVSAPAESGEPSWLEAARQRAYTDDLDGLIKRGHIRVLVVFSKTYYFVDKGRQRGITYEAFSIFERELNKELRLKKRHVHVVFIPETQDRLIPDLVAGRGDIAAAGLTITPERLKQVDFSDPSATGIDEVIVTGPTSPDVMSLDDLAGKQVFVRKSSSYWEHLEALNEKLTAAGKKPIVLKAAPESLADEDLMEMLNAGLVSLLVVDKPVAELWANILPKIKVRSDLAVNIGGEFGWMIRKGNPELATALNAFLKRHGERDPARGEILREYLQSTKFVKNATTGAELKKFQAEVEIFKKYSAQFSVDYLLMMAQGYQESTLDQNVRSRAGAIGVMQVLPTTGKAMRVGDITRVDPNIDAGVKFLTLMRDEYFGNEPMDDLNKLLFSFAAYDAGPARILSLRKLAAQRGFDPNLWFNNVEVVVADRVGMETVTYVSNIYKYYIAYKLVTEVEEERRKAEEGVKQ
jgi:membrane-bound lytic murein transglycosylase MltF